jgi:hypothetical protein
MVLSLCKSSSGGIAEMPLAPSSVPSWEQAAKDVGVYLSAGYVPVRSPSKSYNPVELRYLAPTSRF